MLSSLVIILSDAVQTSDTVVHQFESLVDVILDYFVSEVELGHGLRNSDDGEESSWSDVHVADFLGAFSLELSLLDILGDDVVVQVWWNGWVEGLSMGNE